MVVSVDSINGRIGLNLKAEEMCSLLNRMSLRTKILSNEKDQNLLEVSAHHYRLRLEVDLCSLLNQNYGLLF